MEDDASWPFSFYQGLAGIKWRFIKLGRNILRQDQEGESIWMDSKNTAVIIMQMIFLILLCIFGTLINSLVFWVFNRRPALRSLSNRFVLSLVTANILISSMIAPLILFETILNQYLLLPCISEVISMISNSVIFSAIFSTFLIAVDRFYAVTSPLHYSMTITRSRSQIMIVVAWLSGTLLSLPYIIICSIPFSSELHNSLHVFFTVVQMFLGYVFPFLGLCWLYFRMYNAAHRNSERTRKHSISGELLTVMDGSTSVIPQGIDFLTHYMNPFSKTPMAGSVQQPVTPAGKKHRRRSSNGSASSLFFREEGRAIKTAFLVLASFLLCWTPHFTIMLVNEVEIVRRNFSHIVRMYGDWTRFFSVGGMLVSSVVNPFIYVFRNKMACKEVSKLLCGFWRDKHRKQNSGNPPIRRYESGSSRSTSEYQNPHQPLLHTYQPSTKSPKRSSMKSLTPQSSLNSTITNLNSTGPDSPLMLNGTGEKFNAGINNNCNGKPPFLRSLTLPEQSQPRVKFPPNLIRQKSYYQRSTGSNQQELTPALSRKSRFVRQDSICSIVSTDSVLMICAEDGVSVSDVGGSVSVTHSGAMTGRYLRQDSNFSDVSHRTTDSGVVIDMVKCMNGPSAQPSSETSNIPQIHPDPPDLRTCNGHLPFLQTTI
ncbi:unnamed protein product [Allacma fusca]|uniref:G-protein coupled receptors family 1 profile domain-containing protein n=1 Tax=Allacma fusca TaxID=39272 RepID=A0A8J2KAM5_9HEXA|nr:unnamed protein product [Allacma fusca]